MYYYINNHINKTRYYNNLNLHMRCLPIYIILQLILTSCFIYNILSYIILCFEIENNNIYINKYIYIYIYIYIYNLWTLHPMLLLLC